jgi:anti-sigma B factor antagonist
LGVTLGLRPSNWGGAVSTVERQAPRSIVERELRIEIGPEAETCLIRVAGELDLGTVPVLERELHRLLSHDLRRVILDLEDLEFIDSTGLGCLLAAANHSRVNGDRLRIIGASGYVDRILRLTGIREVLPLIET